MNTLPQTQKQIKITINSREASDILTGLDLLARIHPGEVVERCRRLSNYLWAQAFHDLGRAKAA